jgi:CO/xanthine dehydrogenase Mo-binding subunit
VHVDGAATRTCITTVDSIGESAITTIEETHLIKNAEAPGGIGEAPTSIVSAAVTNAIFAATGKRLRNLPFDTDSLKSSS